MFDLNFTSAELHYLCHPRHEAEAKKIFKELNERGLRSHFIIFSSGTTSGGSLKGYALSKAALLTNAEAVNHHFSLTKDDIWGLSLPHYHVGGLSVLARAHLLNTPVVPLGSWDPERWYKDVRDKKITITTVVPTQVYDLVVNGFKSPPELKFLVVGGDFLAQELEKRAVNLGWPIIRTFGMTEVCSQLASAKNPGEDLRVLPIHQVKTDLDGRLLVKSQSLFTLEFKYESKLYLTEASQMCDSEGFYRTQDLVSLEGGVFKHLGRKDDQVKISGRLISLNELKEKLYDYTLKHNLYGELELQIEDDSRQGKKLTILHLQKKLDFEAIKSLFSPLRPEFKKMASFERTDLGKLKR